MSAYFKCGLVGLFFAYWLRFFVKLLSAITPEAAAMGAGASQDGPITRLVKAHYYLVDCVVTLVLGLAALISLAGTDAPPAFASRYHTALLAGLTVGLLTNSELLTKLTTRLPARI